MITCEVIQKQLPSAERHVELRGGISRLSDRTLTTHMSEQMAIRRVCFNFLSHCNMHCDYCYCPFNASLINADVCRRVVERCAYIGAKVITFGGGDPFMHKELPVLVRLAGQLGMKVHIDTNGLMLRPEHYDLLDEYVSLLGLPIDGGIAEKHDEMRDKVRHFAKVTTHLSLLRTHSVPIKINTIVSRQNVSELPAIDAILHSFRISRWSLYQYWALAGGAGYSSTHEISDAEYLAAIAPIVSRQHSFSVETGLVADRHNTYFFVAHNGEVYCTAPDDTHTYLTLGSIFSDSTLHAWEKLAASSMRPTAESRYDLRNTSHGEKT